MGFLFHLVQQMGWVEWHLYCTLCKSHMSRASVLIVLDLQMREFVQYNYEAMALVVTSFLFHCRLFAMPFCGCRCALTSLCGLGWQCSDWQFCKRNVQRNQSKIAFQNVGASKFVGFLFDWTFLNPVLCTCDIAMGDSLLICARWVTVSWLLACWFSADCFN